MLYAKFGSDGNRNERGKLTVADGNAVFHILADNTFEFRSASVSNLSESGTISHLYNCEPS